jgi:hypothetical protein
MLWSLYHRASEARRENGVLADRTVCGFRQQSRMISRDISAIPAGCSRPGRRNWIGCCGRMRRDWQRIIEGSFLSEQKEPKEFLRALSRMLRRRTPSGKCFLAPFLKKNRFASC